MRPFLKLKQMALYVNYTCLNMALTQKVRVCDRNFLDGCGRQGGTRAVEATTAHHPARPEPLQRDTR